MLSTSIFDQSSLTGRSTGASADTRALRQLALLMLGALGCTLFIVGFLVLAALQAVSMIDAAGRERELAQVIRYVDAMPSGMNEITLDAMARTLALKDARLTFAADVQPGELSVSLALGSDNVVAWTPQLVGAATFEQVAPLRIGGGIVFAVMVGLIGWRVVVVSNGLDRRRAAATRLASTDTLTGLGNRRAFDEGLETRLSAAAEGAPGIVLVLIDLDGFKAINDQLGHSAGDAVLQIVASHLRETAGRDDLVVRLGGDEFAVVRPAGGLDDYLAALDERFAAPIMIGNRRVRVGASIGMARSDDFPGEPSRLVQAADIALYRAKRNGPGQAELAIPSARGRQAA